MADNEEEGMSVTDGFTPGEDAEVMGVLGQALQKSNRDYVDAAKAPDVAPVSPELTESSVNPPGPNWPYSAREEDSQRDDASAARSRSVPDLSGPKLPPTPIDKSAPPAAQAAQQTVNESSKMFNSLPVDKQWEVANAHSADQHRLVQQRYWEQNHATPEMAAQLNQQQYAAMRALPYDKRPEFIRRAAEQNFNTSPGAGLFRNNYQQRVEAVNKHLADEHFQAQQLQAEAPLAKAGIAPTTWSPQQHADFLAGKDPVQIQHESNNQWLLSTPEGRRSVIQQAGQGDPSAQMLLSSALGKADSPAEIDGHRVAWAQERAIQRANEGNYPLPFQGADQEKPEAPQDPASPNKDVPALRPAPGQEQVERFDGSTPSDPSLDAWKEKNRGSIDKYNAQNDKLFDLAKQHAAAKQQTDQQMTQQGLQSGALRYTPSQKNLQAKLSASIAHIESLPGIPEDRRQAAIERFQDQLQRIKPQPVPIDEIPPTLAQQVQSGTTVAYGHVFTAGKGGLMVPRGMDNEVAQQHINGGAAMGNGDQLDTIRAGHEMGQSAQDQAHVQRLREVQANQKAQQAEQLHQQQVAAQQQKLATAQAAAKAKADEYAAAHAEKERAAGAEMAKTVNAERDKLQSTMVPTNDLANPGSKKPMYGDDAASQEKLEADLHKRMMAYPDYAKTNRAFNAHYKNKYAGYGGNSLTDPTDPTSNNRPLIDAIAQYRKAGDDGTADDMQQELDRRATALNGKGPIAHPPGWSAPVESSLKVPDWMHGHLSDPANREASLNHVLHEAPLTKDQFMAKMPKGNYEHYTQGLKFIRQHADALQRGVPMTSYDDGSAAAASIKGAVGGGIKSLLNLGTSPDTASGGAAPLAGATPAAAPTSPSTPSASAPPPAKAGEEPESLVAARSFLKDFLKPENKGWAQNPTAYKNYMRAKEILRSYATAK